MPATASSSHSPALTPNRWPAFWAAVAALTGGLTLLWGLRFHRLLLYGDATAHLAIARRILDSATPGPSQLGTVWLPLPHVLMAPFTLVMAWWRNGIAGALPSLAAFALAAWLLHRLLQPLLGGCAANWAAAAFCLNPSLLYLSAIPMTETIYLACFLGVVFACSRYAAAPSPRAAWVTGAWALAATLCRYDAWFVLPFALATLVFLSPSRPTAVRAAWRFSLLAGAGPIFWFVYNAYYFKDPLAFARGPYSARAIQGTALYPGEHAWGTAALYFIKAVAIAVGVPLGLLALFGLVIWLRRRPWRHRDAVLALLLLPLPFYVWAMWSGNVPIFVPQYWPHGFYNLRYGIQLLPAVAAFSGLLVAAVGRTAARLVWKPARVGTVLGLALLVAASYLAMLRSPGPGVYAEAVHNAGGRLAVEAALARSLAPWRPGQRILMYYGSFPGALPDAGIPLHAVIQESNYLLWQRALSAPQNYVAWVVLQAGSPLSRSLNLSSLQRFFAYAGSVRIPGQPEISVYRRSPAPS